MKKLTPCAAIAAIAASAIASVTACSGINNRTATSTSPSDTTIYVADAAFAADTVIWSDTLGTGSNKATCTLRVVWPEGESAPADSARRWIVTQLAVNGYTTGDAAPAYTAGTDSLTNSRDILATVGRNVLSAACAELESLEREGVDGLTYEYSWTIIPEYITDKFVTYGASTYAYIGGAHGASSYNGEVFSLADGSRIGRNMFRNGSTDELRRLLERGLQQYFEVPNTDELYGRLMLESDTLPLPAATPQFFADGICFTYGQYEIAPYADGMPSCIIPYAEAKPLLTPTAAALLPTSADKDN